MIPYNLFFTFPATIDQDGIHAERGRACVAICTTSSMITISVYLIALVRFLLAELMIGTVSQRWVSLTARTGFSLLLAELMIGTLQGARQRCAILQFQSPISGVNDWNIKAFKEVAGINLGFSLLLAELMIGTSNF